MCAIFIEMVILPSDPREKILGSLDVLLGLKGMKSHPVSVRFYDSLQFC